MIKKLRENKFFSEKGSVTLFILIAIIFFLIVSLNVYSSNKNKLIAQTEEIKAIEENYNKDLENMDEIYENLVKADLKTVFIKESTINSPNKVEYNLSEWTNENVIAKVTVSSENNPDAQLQVKVTSKKTGNTVTYNKSQVDNNEVIITENSTVVVTFGDKEQRIELTKFDKEIPVLFYDSFYIKNNGKYASGTWTNKETYTTISVKEEISGIPEMYYSTDKQNWIKLDFNQSNGIYQELNKYCGKETWTLKDGRIEDIYFRAKDRAGNYSNISNVYQLRYDLTAPTKPIIENEYNDIWTNKDVEIIAKSSDSLSKISKIEYSYDEVDWQSNWQGILQNNGNEASISGKWDNSFNGKIYVRAIDNAGNISETSYTTVKQDIIPPTVNITPNGNTYYIPAGGKTTLKAKLEALDNESGLHTLEYAWSTSNTVEPINWETFENGKEIVKNDATSGTYYLWTNVIDNVGNKASKIKVSNPFIVSSNNSEAFKIVITSTPTTWTKDNVNITITYGSALTQGKKAGMGISIEEAKNAASENTANQMVVTTNNYYIYAEAIDGNGNKVTATKQITNIDKIAPTVELGTNGGTYTVAQNSNFAQITTSINAQDVNGSGLNTLEYQISSSSTLPLDDDPNWKTFTNGNIITENISGGIWYLYTKVTDNAGNRAINIQKSNPYIANYSVIYDANGGKGAPDSQIKEHNKTITLSTIQPSRTGYTFAGWYDAASGGNKIGNAGAAYTPTSAKTLYAHWTINQYTLTVNPNGGIWNGTTTSSTFTQSYASTKAIANPTAPAGYKVTFNGNGGTTPSAITSTKSFSGWTSSGSGTLSGTTYTFGAGNGTLTANYKNNSITLPTPTRTGYTFAGWYDAASGGNKIGNAGAAYTPTSAKTLYAHWTINQYTLTVNPNGGIWNGTTTSSTFTQSYASTKAIANPTAPAGYKVTFNGNGGSTPSAITSTKSFTSWTKGGSGTLSGTTYTFGAGNGTLTANYTNNSITLPTPTRTGYTFTGWYDAASGGNKIGNGGATYTPTYNRTMYAHWADTQAPVINKFELGDITASSIKVEVNATDNVAIQKYEFYLDNVLKGTLTTSSTSASYTYTNLTPLKTYSLKVVVRDTSGNSSTKTITKKLTNVVEIKNVKRDGYDVYAYTDATGIQEVLFPTWTEKNNQDDMIWKAGTLEKTGVYYFRVNVSDHNYEYGKYNTHAYYNTANQKNIFIAGTSTEIKSEKYLTTKNINREGFDIEYYTDSPGLSKVEFPVWTEKKIGNTTQDDIKWYAAKSVGNGAYTYHVGVASHNYESGKYNIHTYEKNASGVSNLTLGTSATVPNTEMAYIWNVTSKGYNVTVYTNRSNVSEVLLPTWTNKNSQDDIEWITTRPLGNGAYIGEVKVSNHNYESGWYNTHVYAKINGKDQMITTLGVNIVAESPPAHTCNTGGYCTTLHNHSYGWSCECGGYHYQYRHPICTICGKKSPVSWFKCPNRPEGIPMNCPG